MTAVREFDAARYLDNEEVMAEYLSACLESGPEAFLAALGDIAKARGMAALARDAGLARESLYKTLGSKGVKPRFETILRITHSLGIPLAVKPSGTPRSKQGAPRRRAAEVRRWRRPPAAER